MDYRATRRRIIKVLDSKKPNLKKYSHIRKLFLRQSGKYQARPRSNKDLITKVLPILEKILNEPDTQKLFGQFYGYSQDIGKTADFILFLKRVTNGES